MYSILLCFGFTLCLSRLTSHQPSDPSRKKRASFPRAPAKLPRLTLHWSSWTHMFIPEPITGVRGRVFSLDEIPFIQFPSVALPGLDHKRLL